MKKNPTDLISINEAVKLGITKLRLDHWINSEDHIEIHIVAKGWIGPWVKLWSPVNEAIGQENPQEMMVTALGDADDKCWRQYAPKEISP